MEQNQAYDFFGLKSANLPDSEIYNLGHEKVALFNADDAYKNYGNGEDRAEFQKKYDAVAQDYLNFKNSSYLRDATQGDKQYPFRVEAKGGEMIGAGAGMSNVKTASDQQIAADAEIKGLEKGSTKKFKDFKPGELALEYTPDGNPFWRKINENESVAGKEVNSIWGPSEMYSSWINKAWSGLWNGSIAELPSGAAGIAKTAGDLGEAIYNASHGKGWTASGTAPWDNLYNRSNAFSKSLMNINDDQHDNMWYDFNQGLASLLTAAASGYAGGMAGKALGLSEAGIAGLSKYASTGIGSMQVMDSFIEQSKAAGIPDADIALMSPIFGAVTAWSESALGPEWVFNQYEKAGGKKIFQKEFIDPLLKMAEQGGVKEIKDLPKSAYGKAINNSVGKLASIWHGLKTGEGLAYDVIQGGLGEATEEFSEGLVQNSIMQGYDAFKVNYDKTNDKLEKNNGLYFGKDFSLGKIYHNVTDGLGYQALMGGLTGSFANTAMSLVHGNSQKNAQQKYISQAIIDGRTDELKQQITDAYQKNKNWPGASWTDGQNAVTLDSDGNPTSKSVKDMVYEQAISTIDLMKDIYDKSGVGNADFIANQLGGDKSLAYSALEAILGQKQGEAKLTQLQAEKEQAIKEGKWTEPQTPDQDEIALTQQGIDKYKADLQYIASGKAYSDKLKNNLIPAYLAKNPEYIFKTKGNDEAFMVNAQIMDQLNAQVPVNRAAAMQKAQDILANREQNLATHEERINNLKNSQLDKEFFANLDSLLTDVKSYGIAPKNAMNLSDTLAKHITEQRDASESEEMTLSPEQEQSLQNATALSKHLNTLEAYKNFTPTASYDEKEFLLDQYFPNRHAINKYNVDDEQAKKIVYANPAAIEKGGEIDTLIDDLNLARQRAAVNYNVYNNLDAKHTGVEKQDMLTKEQFDAILTEADNQEKRLNEIREESEKAVNDRKTEQSRLNVVNLKLKNHVLDYAIKMSNVKDTAKDAIAALHMAMDKINSGDTTEETIGKVERAITEIESKLHTELNKDKGLKKKIIEHIVTTVRRNTQYDLTNTSLLYPIEFLGTDFDKIFDVKSLEGLDPAYAKPYHETFAQTYVNGYLNDIMRIDANEFNQALYDVVSARTGSTPSYEQIQVIRQLTGFLHNPNNEWIIDSALINAKYNKTPKAEVEQAAKKLLNNSIFVRGFAGAGKTTNIAPIAIQVYKKMTGKENLSILHVAPTDGLIDKLGRATSGLSGTSPAMKITTQNFIESTENMTNRYDLVIVDEASLFNEEACAKLNSLQAKGTPIIFLGDQSQVSDSLVQGKLLPIEGLMERTTPVTVSYRNSSVDVNTLLAQYRKAIFNETQAKLPSVVYNQAETFGAKYYQSENDIIDAFNKDLQAGTESWIIVTDSNQRTAWIDKLMKNGVNSLLAERLVKTIKFDKYTAQGLENAKVYVAIRPSDVMKNGNVDHPMLNRMMLTAISRVGAKSTDIGFVGVLDESGQGKSSVGKPIETRGIEVDKPATLAKIKNMIVPELLAKKTTEPQKATPTPSGPTTQTPPSPTQTGKKPQLKGKDWNNLLARIDAGEPGIIEFAKANFDIKDAQLEDLIQYQKLHDQANEPDYATQLTSLGWSKEEIGLMSDDDMKSLATRGIRKIVGRPASSSRLQPSTARERFISSAEKYNQADRPIPIDFFAVEYTGVAQENLIDNAAQKAKINFLASAGNKQVVVKVVPSMRLTNTDEEGKPYQYDAKNVFAVYSDNTPNAVMLGVLFSVDSDFNNRGIDSNIIYNDARARELKDQIKLGFISEKNEQKRQMLIDYHTGMVDLKLAAAKNPEGVMVPISSISPANASTALASDKKPTLTEWLQHINTRYGEGSVQFTAPYQVSDKTNGRAYLAIKVSFFGDPENGLEIPLRMSNLSVQDIDDILFKDGVETDNEVMGLTDAIEFANMSELATSRAAEMLNYNMSVLRPLIETEKNIASFIKVSPEGKYIDLVGSTANEKFKNLVDFYKYIKSIPNLAARLFNVPQIVFEPMMRDSKATFDLKNWAEIGDKITVEVNSKAPLSFPSFTVSNTPTAVTGVSLPNADTKITSASKTPGSVDFGEFFEETKAKPAVSAEAQRITRERAKSIVARLLGDSFDVRFSDRVYSKDGKELYGVARNGYILFEDREGVEYTTPRHEVLHQVMNFALDPKYRAKLIDNAKQVMSDMHGTDISTITDKDAEEFMANQYGNTNGMPPHALLAPIWRFLTWLKNLFIRSKTDQDILNDFYNEIEYGKFYGDVQGDDSSFVEATHAKPVDSSITGDETEDRVKSYYDLEEARLRAKYGDLQDYNSVSKVFGSIENADKLKPAFKMNIVKMMFPSNIYINGELIAPMSLIDAIKQMEADYLTKANTQVSSAFVDRIVNENINGDNVLEKLTPAEMPMYALYQIKQDPTIIYKYVQSILPEVNVAKLLDTGNINQAMSRTGEDTISKKENELVDLADKRSAFIELILDSIPSKTFGVKNGKIVEVGVAKGIVNGSMIKRSLEDAGAKGAALNNFASLQANLMSMAREMTMTVNGDTILTPKGNAIMSFLAHIGNTENVNPQNSATWTFNYLATNPEQIESVYDGIQDNPLWDVHLRNASNIINSISNAFFVKKANPIQIEHTSEMDEESGQVINRMKSVVLRPTMTDSIKNELKNNSDSVVFSVGGSQVILNPDLAIKLNSKYIFREFGNGYMIYANEQPVLSIKLKPGGFEFGLNPDANSTDVRLSEPIKQAIKDMLRVMGMEINKNAIDIFWTDRGKQALTERVGEHPFDKQRLADIAGTLMLSAKTLVDKSFKANQNITSRLMNVMKDAGNTVLEPKTSGKFGTPAPSDFYRMVEQLAIAQSSAIGDKYRGMYFTVEGARAYMYVPSDTFHDDFGHGGRLKNEDGAIKKQKEFKVILDAHTDNGRVNEDTIRFASTNPNISIVDNKVRVNNLILTTDPNYHIRIGEKYENKGVTSDFKGNAYGKGATVRDVINSHLTPFIESVLDPTTHQTIPLPTLTRADSTQNEIINYYFPEGKIVTKSGITQKGKEMMDRMLVRVFENHYREMEVSQQRWLNYLTSRNMAPTQEEWSAIKANPYAIRTWMKAKFAGMEGNIIQDIVSGNSGLWENKDFRIVKGQLEPGYATLFNSQIVEQDGGLKIDNLDGIFNWNNFTNLNSAASYEDLSSRLKEMYTPAYKEMADYMKSTGYKMPMSVGQEFYAVKDGKYTLNPVFEAFFVLNTIAQNSLMPISVGHINQYKSIADYYKRVKEGPGSTAAIGGKTGLFPTYRNVVINDVEGIHHEQLEKMGIIKPEDKLTANFTDGLQMMSPTFQMEVYDAFGGDLGPLGKGQYKFNHREYNLSDGVFRYVKSSSFYFTPEIIDLASTFGASHLENKDNYFEETLQRMYSPRLYGMLNDFRSKMPFEQAVRELVKVLKANPELRKEVNDVLTFKSAIKSSVNMVNDGNGTFEQMVPMTMDSRNLRHQVNTDQEEDDAEATAVKQGFAFLGILGHNKQYIDSINEAQNEIAQTQINQINKQIESASGDTYKEKFHNYLRSIGIDQAIAMADYGPIVQALQSNVSLEPSIMKNRVVRNFMKKVSRAMRFKSPGIRVIQNPALFRVYDGNDGITYTLADIKKMTPEQAEKLGLTKNEGRMMHTDRIENGVMLPAEVIGTYIHKKSFGIKEEESLHDVMSIRMKDGEFTRTDNMSDEDLIKFIKKNIDNIDIAKTPMMRESMYAYDKDFGKTVVDYRNKFYKSLTGIAFRIPAHGAGSGQYRKLIGFISDYSSVQFGNPLKNIINGSDYDADQLSDFSFSRVDSPDNKILEGMVGFYSNPLNHSTINTPVTTKDAEAIADQMKDDMKFQPGSYATNLKMYKLNNDGKQIIDRFAIAGKIYGLAWQAYQNDSTIFKGLNFNKEARDNFGELVNMTTAKFLQLAVDNAKLQVLGIIGANPESVNTIMGMILSKDKVQTTAPVANKFGEIADFLSRYHIKRILEIANGSRSIDETPKRIYKIAQKQIGFYQNLIDNPTALAESTLRFMTKEQLQSTVADIKQLIKFDVMGEAFMRLNTVFTFDSKGMPSENYDRYNKLFGSYGAEFSLGMPLDKYLAGDTEFRKQNPEWFMEKRKFMPDEKLDEWTVTRQEELERERIIRHFVDVKKVLDASPLQKAYVKIAYDSDKQIQDNFLLGSKSYQGIRATVLNQIGLDSFKSQDQFNHFDREFERLVVSTYLNQTNHTFNHMDVSTTTEPYTLRTPEERVMFQREFTDWFKSYIAENPELVSKNMFLKNISVGSNDFGTFITFPFKDSMSTDMKAAIQGDALKLKDTAKFKFEYNGKAISNISIYDAIVLYQLSKEDFSGKRNSFMELLGADGLSDIGRYIDGDLVPSIENGTQLSLYDENNMPMQKSFLDIANDWIVDMLNMGNKDLLQKGSKKKIKMWQNNAGPKYFKMTEEGKTRMVELTDAGPETIFGRVDKNGGYSVGQPISAPINEKSNGQVADQEMDLPNVLMSDLLNNKTITLEFPQSSDYHIGLVALQGGLKAYIKSVSPDGKILQVEKLKPANEMLPTLMRPADANFKGAFTQTIPLANGETADVVIESKQSLLQSVVRDGETGFQKTLALWLSENPGLMNLIRERGAVIHVDPALISKKVADDLIQSRILYKDDNLIVGGSYNKTTGDIYIHPNTDGRPTVILHEIMHNITEDAFNSVNDNELKQRFRERMNKVYEQVKAYADAKDLTNKVYGFSNAKEMVSEAMSNPKFQALLQEIPSTLRQYSLWDEFLDAIRRFLVEDLGMPESFLGNHALGDIIAETGLFIDASSKARIGEDFNKIDPVYQEFLKNNIFAPTSYAKEYFDKCKKGI